MNIERVTIALGASQKTFLSKKSFALAKLQSQYGLTKEKIDLYLMQKVMRFVLEYGGSVESAFLKAQMTVDNCDYSTLLTGDNPLSGTQNTIRDNIQLANIDDLRKCVGYYIARDLEKAYQAGLDVTEGIFKGRADVAKKHLNEFRLKRHIEEHGVNFILVGEVTTQPVI